MARSTSSRNSGNRRPSSSGAPQRKRASSPSEKSGKRQVRTQPRQAAERQPVIDNGTQRNLVGIVCAVVALALILIVAWPTNAVVTVFLSRALRLGLGVGAYILPIMLIVVAGTFVARFDAERVPARVIIGLSMMFVAFLVLMALFTPNAVGDSGVTAELFDSEQVLHRGGYLGAGPAWVGLTLFGLPVAVVIAVGIMASGLAIIGFSIRGLVGAIRERKEEALAREEEELSVAPDSPYIPASQIKAPRRSSVDHSARTEVIASENERPRRNSADLDDQAGSRSQKRSASLEFGNETKSFTRRLGKDSSRADGAKDEKAPVKAEQQEPVLAVAPDDDFKLPKMTLLKASKEKKRSRMLDNELADTAARLQQTMADFGIMAEVVDWIAGPTVTLFEVDLPPGVRVSRIMALNDDIALALAAPGVRIFAPIPGTHYVGIEVPNAKRENVLLADVLKDVKGGPLEMAIGKDVEGNSIICDLAKMPHLLIGGTTGSGKSVGINAMIMSMLMRATPSQVRFIMIDPKRVEFAPYDGIPHLYVPVVTEPKEAASALSWGVAEMERRLKMFSKVGVRNISTYNEKARKGELSSADDVNGTDELPYIVIIIDELADLMMNVGKEVEFSISRIAQLARAAGIHLIVATQRPSANVVTGLIKANITNRIAFNVASGLDSRVILDTSGAESLIGNGDLLLSKPEYQKPLRIQGCFTSDEEIASVVEAVKSQGEPEYHSEILKTNLITLGDSMPDGSGGSASSDDPLIWEAAEIVVASGLGSTSNIQRKLKVGYSRAGRIMDMLEEKGVVGPPNGSKPRDVLVDAMELETLKAFEQADEQ